MKYLQRIGKSLMLPVSTLPIAALLYGIGYWIQSYSWGQDSTAAAFLVSAGSAILNNMGILFAVGIGVGMAHEHDGTSALASLLCWLVITTLLSPASVSLLSDIAIDEVDAAFSHINNQFIGILSGIVGASCYNRFRRTKLPDALGFFSGKRSVSIISATIALLISVVLFFVWPFIYNALVRFGELIVSSGGIGAAIYAAANRLLIPFGMHHALNSVFWFDIAGINDLSNFWQGTGVLGQTGAYMTGFFPVTMFGLPAGALAMYHTAKSKKKKLVAGLLFSAALAAFLTGVTEPIEFAFMFLAPGLYLIHAVLTGLSALICFFLPVRVGFNFSAGLIDYVLSMRAPMAQNPWIIIPVGLGFGIVYYFIFRWIILAFNLKTPGREGNDDGAPEENLVESDDDYSRMADEILYALGGSDNITTLDNCITRLRLEIADESKIDEPALKKAGALGVMRTGKNSVQVIIGTKVEFVADEMKKSIGKTDKK